MSFNHIFSFMMLFSVLVACQSDIPEDSQGVHTNDFSSISVGVGDSKSVALITTEVNELPVSAGEPLPSTVPVSAGVPVAPVGTAIPAPSGSSGSNSDFGDQESSGSGSADLPPVPTPIPVPKRTFTLTMTVAAPFRGFSVSSPAGINCDKITKHDCSAPFEEGTQVTIRMPRNITVPSFQGRTNVFMTYTGSWTCNGRSISSPLLGSETRITINMSSNMTCGAHYRF